MTMWGNNYMGELHGGEEGEDDIVQSHGFTDFEGEEAATFDIRPIEIKPHIRSDLSCVAISQQCLLMATTRNQIFRTLLLVPGKQSPEVLDMPVSADKGEITKLFIDTRGYHCIVSTRGPSVCYLHLNTARIRILQKLRGIKISSVGFAWTKSDSAKEILIGTEQGQILQYQLDIDPKTAEPIEKSLKVVLELREKKPITGIVFETYTVMAQKQKALQTHVLVVTDECCYQFVGGLPFDKLFERYADPKELNKHIKKLPKGDFEGSEIKVFYRKIMEKEEPHSFAWMTAVGVYHGKFREKQNITQPLIIKDFLSDSYQKNGVATNEMPVSVGISEYHLFFLYPDNLTVISKITKEMVFSGDFKPTEDMKGLLVDWSTCTMWAYSTRGVYRIIMQGEDKDLWKLHVESGNFSEALEHCRANNQVNIPYVSGLYADSKFNSGKYTDAARLYAESGKSFEEVVLKYLMCGQNDGLELYLIQKLEAISLSGSKKTQRMLLCSWILELKLDKLNKLAAIVESEKHSARRQSSDNSASTAILELKNIQENFHDFIQEYDKDLDNDTIFQLLQSHGKISECITFASLKGNFEAVILHYINNREYAKALHVLEKITSDEERNALMLRYGSIFMKQEPKRCIEALFQSFQNIPFDKLIPALMSVDKQGRIFATNLLRSWITKTSSKLVHNLYLFFLAECTEKFGDEELLKFLEQQEGLKSQNQPLNIDVEFALNICKHFGKVEAQIRVYAILEYYEEAVKLAISRGDMSLGKEYARKAPDSKVQKQLWLKIAKTVMKSSQTDNMKLGLEILNESKGILGIDDILPFVSSKVKLESFKTDICAALDQYGIRIDELKKTMVEYNQNTSKLMDEMREKQNKFIKMGANHFCEDCKKPLLNGSRFFIFPCLHGYHKDCLYDNFLRMKPLLEGNTKHLIKIRKLEKYRKEILQLQGKKATKMIANSNVPGEDRYQREGAPGGGFGFGSIFFTGRRTTIDLSPNESDDIQILNYERQFEGLLHEECLTCGECIIDTIDKPFDPSREDAWFID